MSKIRRIAATLSATAVLLSGILCLTTDDAWARGGGGRGGGRGGRVSVRGYYRSNGTYVSPYTRSAPGGGSSYGSGYGSGYSGNGLSTEYSSFGTYMNWGYDAAAAKNYDLALHWFEQALQEKPNDPYARKAIQNVKKYAAATPTYSTTYSAGGNVDMFETYMKMGYSAAESKIYDLALHWFNQALSERPNNPYAIKAIQNIQTYMQSGW
ncbi:hypothetical protein NIES2101_43010 [Calothrix sp. HK-06]|nr:hypothetical protein NIES2101_43010 [Calothrix sp. HK-06]